MNFYRKELDKNLSQKQKEDLKNLKVSFLNEFNEKLYSKFLKTLTSFFPISRHKTDYDMYSKILPYDDSVSRAYGIEYINASFLKTKNTKIILAQLPKKKYRTLFAELIQKSKSQLIISFEQLNEQNDYFVNIIKIESQAYKLKENIFFYDETFELGCDKIRRLHFVVWNDFSVPKKEEFEFFYDFFKKIQYDTLIVHCKAGVGRSGTFLMRYLMDQTNCKTKDEFLDLLLYVRSCRNYCVFNKNQLEFLLNYINQ